MEIREVPKFILCPECNEKYDDAKKRRVIDSCGHPRCFTCLYNSPVCPLCSRSKQAAPVGAQSPTTSERNGYLQWKPRSASMSCNDQQRMSIRDRRSKSLVQLSSRSPLQKVKSPSIDKDKESDDIIMNGADLFSEIMRNNKAHALSDNHCCDVIETSPVNKIDRKMSFSSVLNRNSESYKQSRFRRASSFSFMPKDIDMTSNSEVLSFESKLKIKSKARPRPRSLNISHLVASSIDSPQNSDCSEGNRVSNKRKTRLDSVVEMAAAWLEESKSVMENQYFSVASETFGRINEERTDPDTEKYDIAKQNDSTVRACIDQAVQKKVLEAGFNKAGFDASSHLVDDVTTSTGFNFGAQHSKFLPTIENNENDTKTTASDDSVRKACDAGLAAGEDDECYFNDIRELIQRLRKKKESEKAAENGDKATQYMEDTQGICMEDSNDEIDSTPRVQSPRRYGTCVNPFKDLEKNKDFNIDEIKPCQQNEFESLPYKQDDCSQRYGKGLAYVNNEGEIVRDDRRSRGREDYVNDTERNEQQENRLEFHGKTNTTVTYKGWHTSSKQIETPTLTNFPLGGVPRGVEKRNSCSFVASNDHVTSNDRITTNDSENIDGKTFDIVPRAFVNRPRRSKSFSSRSDIKVTMTEIQYLPSLKKNRRKRPSSVGSFRPGYDVIHHIKESDVDAYDNTIIPVTSEAQSEGSTIISIQATNQNQSGGAAVINQSSEGSEQHQSHGYINDTESKSAVQSNDADFAMMQSADDHEDTSSLGAASSDVHSRSRITDSTELDLPAELNSVSTFSLSTQECSTVSQTDGEPPISCQEIDDRVEEILTNKTDDWKTANFHIIHSKVETADTRCDVVANDLTVQDAEVPVVFVNGDDFNTSWFKSKEQGRKSSHLKKEKIRKEKSNRSPVRGSQTHGIGFLREQFHKLTKWSKRGTDVDASKRNGSSTRNQHKRSKEKKNLSSHDMGKNTTQSCNSKNISLYDANRNIVISSELVKNTKGNRKVRRHEFDKEEGSSLNRIQSPKNDKQSVNMQGKEQLEKCKKHDKLRCNGNENHLLKPNDADEASLTTVSTLTGTFRQNNDSDSDSSVFSENDSVDDGDSSDSTLSGHMLHSSYSTSSDTINESVQETEMPDFKSPSRIQDDLAALLERKVTRKRLGLEEINFHPLIPATKGKALVSRDWLYERLYDQLSRNKQIAKRVLLISGRRGCGKTTFLKSLIWSDCISRGKRRMRERIANSILSFHFCSKADPNTTSVAKFILNMATRLVENNDFSAFTKSLSESEGLRSKLSCEATETSPETALLEGILKPLSKLYGSGSNKGTSNKHYLLVVDSLDHECRNCSPEECITTLLASIVHLLPSWTTLVIAGTKESLQVFDEVETDKINLENVANWDVQSDLYSFTEMELPIVSSQISQSKIQKLVDNVVRVSRGSFHIAHMSVQYLSSSFTSSVHQPSLQSLDASSLVGHLFRMKFCSTERNRILALSLLDVLYVAQELFTVSNLFKAIESSCTSQSVPFQEYESCLAKLLDLQLIAESTEGRIFLNNITRGWMQGSDGLKSGFNPSKGHNLLSVYYMKSLANNDSKYIYLLAYHISQSNFGEDMRDKEKRINFLAWTFNQVFKATIDGFMESCNIYRPITEVYHLFLHTELDMKAFERRYGVQPIVLASSLKQTQIVALLLEHGMYQPTHLHQALTEASKVGSMDILDLLIPNTHGLSLLKPREENTTQSCLDIALENSHLMMAVKLLKFIWKSQSEDDSEKSMAAQQVLCEACLHGRIDITEELFSGGYINDVDTLDTSRNAPLVLAASRNQLIVAKYLVENQGNVNVVDGHGLTPLLASVMNKHAEISEWLISQDANVTVEDKDGRTPLIHAAANDMPQLVHSLFMEGASINHQDRIGLTALSHACKNSHKEVVKTLLKNRAVTEIEDKHKRTALHYACLSRSLRSIQLLLDNGANINHKNSKGHKPLEVALKDGYLDVAALLLRYGAHVGRSAVSIAESNIGAFLCLVGHLEQRGNIMIKAGKFAAANEDFQRALNIIENSKHRNNKRVIRIKLLCQQDSRKKFI